MILLRNHLNGLANNIFNCYPIRFKIQTIIENIFFLFIFFSVHLSVFVTFALYKCCSNQTMSISAISKVENSLILLCGFDACILHGQMHSRDVISSISEILNKKQGNGMQGQFGGACLHLVINVFH